MKAFPLFVFLSAVPTQLLAQAQSPSEPPLKDDGSTPYSESFTTGDVEPLPQTEGDLPDADVNPNRILEDDENTFGGNFLIGLTAALEFPHVINAGLETLTYRKFGVSANYGNLTRNVSGVDVGMRHADVRFRYHPWAGSFFGGLALGQHRLTGEKTRDVSYTPAGTTTAARMPTKVKVIAESNYVAPHIGWFAVWDPGFTMGFDIGWMIPVSPKSTTDVSFTNMPAGAEDAVRNSDDFKKAVTDVNDAAESYAKKSLPFISMIRVGWMF